MLRTEHRYAQSIYPSSISAGAYNVNDNTWHDGLRQLQNIQFKTKPTEFSARNNSGPLAIFQAISAFGGPKCILISQISHTF